MGEIGMTDRVHHIKLTISFSFYGQVNLSVAIIPMSHQFGWSPSVAGLVQSSFFWGYALSQLPGGWLAKIFGGRLVLTSKAPLTCTKKRNAGDALGSNFKQYMWWANEHVICCYWCRNVLKIGVLTWSLATALVPSLSGFMPGLLLSRIMVRQTFIKPLLL